MQVKALREVNKWVINVSLIKKISMNSILNNFSWLLLQKITQLLSSLVVGILLARYFGAANYGIYSVILAITTVASSLSTVGLNHLITKELKNNKNETQVVISNAIVLRFIGGLSSLILFSGVALLVLDKVYVGFVLFILFLQIFSGLKVVEYYFLSISYMKPYIITNVIVLISSIVTKVIFVYFSVDIAYFLYLLGIDYLLAGILSYKIYRSRIERDKNDFYDKKVAIPLLKKGLPLLLSSVTAIIYLKLDVIMLSYFTTNEEVGSYAVAARLSEIWYMFPTLVASSLFPKLLELRNENYQKYERGLDLSLYFLSFTAFVIACFISVFAEFIVTLLFGMEYINSVDVLRIHIWSGIFIFMRAIASKWFIAEDYYYLSFFTHSAGAITNVILNMVLIPLYGAIGAAVATLISYAMASYLSLFLTKNGRFLAVKMTYAAFWPSFFLKFRKYK